MSIQSQEKWKMSIQSQEKWKMSVQCQDCYGVKEFFSELSVQNFKIFKQLIKESRGIGFVEGMAMERSKKINKSDEDKVFNAEDR